MTANATNQFSRGSVWRRWDPHIHTPGTVLNDQYGDTPEAWESFIARIEASSPTIQVLGITDYLSLATYKKVCDFKAQGRFQNVGLIFPNVEMRLAIGTSRGSAVNVHLLFSPNDPDHADQIERFLSRLQFRGTEDTYGCSRPDLIRLGRAHGGSSLAESAALSVGANQFKVSPDGLQDAWSTSKWVRDNCLIGVAAGEGDGTSGLRDSSGSLESLRRNIEARAHLIFSANPANIEFWLGKRSASVADLEARWGGMKPCLHGSDAHDLDKVGSPDLGRACWIKGDTTFDSLKHACMEPEARVYIGAAPPTGSLNSRTITSMRVEGSPWLKNNLIELNSGLVAVIGARGSGKTALAEMVAAGGLAVHSRLNEKSFLMRAREYLVEGRVSLNWSDGDTSGNHLTCTDAEDLIDYPRVQYLSQQFVDDLCSSDGATDALINEIHNVVFNTHHTDEREGCTSFDELLELRSSDANTNRIRCQRQLERIASTLVAERQLKSEKASLERQVAELEKQISQDEADRSRLIGQGQEVRAKRHQVISDALDARRRLLEKEQLRKRSLASLKADTDEFRRRGASEYLQEMRSARSEAGLSDEEWNSFKIIYAGDVDGILARNLKLADDAEKAILGGPVPPISEPETDVPLISLDSDLADSSVNLLAAELARLARLIGVDLRNSKRLSLLNDKISKSRKSLQSLKAKIELASSADERIRLLVDSRQESYKGVFDSISELESQLSDLYAPLQRSLSSRSGSIGKLGVSVRRKVDLNKWAEAGEELLDLRRAGPFKGKGALFDAAKAELLPAWQAGGSADVSQAMQSFIALHEAELKAHRPDDADQRLWVSAVSAWLHGTDHISVVYALTFDGVEIERLSPGTRGIVLLLLYLAIDEDDDRPLIIDQPEENLDPKSVFDELVERFRSARLRRQVIIVTHNANLVVNTDADQVIVATAGGHEPGKLPVISYISGGLENPEIRRQVCNVLEGGERAFRARAKRLQLTFSEAVAEQVSVSSGSPQVGGLK